MSKLKNVFGMKNKKKADDSDEDSPSYTDPAVLHSTDPPSRNSKGISHPHYPPPRPCHGSNSPNPRRKNMDTAPVQGNRKPQNTENNRNSVPGLPTNEPSRAPPRINITKKAPATDVEDDYCDPIDVQRKDDYIQEMRSQPIKDDYCEPWDSTMKTDATNVSSKNAKKSDDESSEYLEPYDTGRVGIIEKRWSHGIGVQFGKDQRRSAAEGDPKQPVFDPSKPPSDDYDTPWEWKKKNQMQQGRVMVPKPSQPTQRPKSNLPANEKDSQTTSKPSDDYDEPWERKQSYLNRTQVPGPGGKSRSPVPLPRQSHPPQNNDNLVYEQPWDTKNQPKAQPPQADAMYEIPWESTGGGAANGNASPRRFSQPNPPSAVNIGNRKFSQPQTSSDDYDMPWEYKNKQFGAMGPPKPIRLHEIANAQEVNPDLPLKQQEWYHGPLTRVQAEELLRGALDCSFLVRNSESSKKDYSLSMKNNDNFLHLKIVRQLDGQYILGQFSKPFLEIPKVIHHYSINKLNIRGAEHKFLKHPIAVQPRYHTIEPEDEGDINV